VTKAVALFFALLTVAYIAVRPSPSTAPLPKDVPGLAARLMDHPTDWTAASALTEKALDAPVGDRKALWQAAHDLAASLAPLRREPGVAFTRAGFFHWEELSAAERKGVLDAYAPLLGDPTFFMNTYRSIFALTGDLAYLRRAQPATPEATRSLAWLASSYGRFDDYRAIRAELEQRGETVPPQPPPAVGRDRWAGLCNEDVCFSAWREVDANHGVAVTMKPIDTDDVAPYVEIYVDGARRAEGAVGRETTLTATVGAPGVHRIEVRQVNAVTRNSVQRRLRITSLRIL
jgi:hypothetical protein